jgi:TrmH family RNA methyltransferase
MNTGVLEYLKVFKNEERSAFMTEITSKDNPFVKQIVSIIENKKEREKQGLFVSEGLRFCMDAVTSNIRIKTAVVTDEFIKKHPDSFKKIQAASDDIKIISQAVCKKIGATVNSQGVFCLCEMPENSQELTGNRYIVLENLQDPGNMGTIIRTAEAFGMDGVVLVGNCVDVFSSKVLRSTMGTIFRIPVLRFDNLDSLETELKSKDFCLYGAVLDSSSKKLSEIHFNSKTAVAIGNEANGLSDGFKKMCDEFIFIEMNGNAESLNAAVAASVIMWEVQK